MAVLKSFLKIQYLVTLTGICVAFFLSALLVMLSYFFACLIIFVGKQIV